MPHGDGLHPLQREIRKKANPLEILRRVRAYDEKMNHPARTDFLQFVPLAGTDENGAPLEMDPLTTLIASVIDDCHKAKRHISTVIAPGIGKSTLARLKLLHAIGQNPQTRSVIVQGTETDAAQSVALCRDIVTSRNYRIAFPDIWYDYDYEKKNKIKQPVEPTGDEDSPQRRGFKMSEWYLRHDGQRKDPTMQACVVELKGESRRTDIALFDDIIGEVAAQSSALTTRIERAFWNTWVDGRMANGGWCIYLQNLRNAKDLAHKLREQQRFCSFWVGVTPDASRLFVRFYNPPDNLRAISNPEEYGLEESDPSDPTVTPTCEYSMALPVREITDRETGNKVNTWAPGYLLSRNPTTFRTLYRLQASSPEDLMFPSWHSRTISGVMPGEACGLKRVGIIPVLEPLDRMRLFVTLGLDWSSKKRKGKALWIIAKDRNTNVIYPLFHKRISGGIQEVVDLKNRIWGAGLKWDVAYLEDNSVQTELNDAVRIMAKGNEWLHTLNDFTTTSGKWDMNHGLPQLDVRFQSGGIAWCSGMASKDTDWSTCESEFSEMTRDTAVMTPDSIMSFWFAFRAVEEKARTLQKTEGIRTFGPSTSGRGSYSGF